MGVPFAEMGEVDIDDLAESFSPRTPEGEQLPVEGLPGRVALDERRASHVRIWITSRDGVDREVSVTAFPLFAHADEFVGVVVIFWRSRREMRVKIWGCRGSVPTPGPDTVGYGGNTSCIEVSLDNGAVLVLDAGTGIRELGLELQERETPRIHLLLTHLHLDHLEGLRFFAPLFDSRVTIDVRDPLACADPAGADQALLSPPLFPMDLHEIPAKLSFHDVPKEPWTVEGATIASGLVMHPGPTVGYRVESDGACLAYLPDHEPALTGAFEERSRDWISGGSIAENADLLLHDSQYFDEEYAQRVGWGHSSVESAVAFAHAVGARRLVLFHHDPRHPDRTLEQLEVEAASLCGEREQPPVPRARGWCSICDLRPRRDRGHAARSPQPGRPSERRRALAEARVPQSERLDEGPDGARDDRGRRTRRADLARRHDRRVHGRQHRSRTRSRLHGEGLPRPNRNGRLLYGGAVPADAGARRRDRRRALRRGETDGHAEGRREHGRPRGRACQEARPLLDGSVQQPVHHPRPP